MLKFQLFFGGMPDMLGIFGGSQSNSVFLGGKQ